MNLGFSYKKSLTLILNWKLVILDHFCKFVDKKSRNNEGRLHFISMNQGKLNIVPGRISTVGPGENLGRF
jgi:hypothetical protein